MEVICLALGILIGILIGISIGYLFGKNYKSKEQVIAEAEEAKSVARLNKEIANFYAYDGTEKGQVGLNDEE